jgi:predicted nucleic acid-binding protein
MYLLDTMVLSELRKKEQHPGIAAWLSGRSDHELFISVVSIGEISKGIAKQEKRGTELADLLRLWLEKLIFVYSDRILPVDIQTAKKWGELSLQSGNAGADMLLAATAIENNLCIVTRNEKHYNMTGAKIINPWR